MKNRFIIALSLLGGIAVGSLGVHTLNAQGNPPVYMIAVNEVIDPAGYRKNYLPPAQKSIKDHGGVYVAAGAGTIIDGSMPKGRVVILRWGSMEALRAWRNSPEYVAARKIGASYAKYNIVAVEGVKQ